MAAGATPNPTEHKHASGPAPSPKKRALTATNSLTPEKNSLCQLIRTTS